MKLAPVGVNILERSTKSLAMNATGRYLMPNLTIIIGSTRPGRSGAPIAQWFAERAKEHGGFDVTVADLAEIGLPLLDEPNHPRLGQYTREHTREWSAIADGADAFVIVTPEYNAGYPAALKNAIDYLHREWQGKPVGFVSYGGNSAGMRSVQQLKQVVTQLQMLPVNDDVSIQRFTQFLDSDGSFQPDAIIEQSAGTMLDELAETEAALRSDSRAAV
jgi:NAD(P)H-dependent FMN reductase